MSRLSELTNTLCPNGVPHKTLGELLGYEQPNRYIVSSKDYNDDYDTPVLTAGKGLLLGYTDERVGIYQASHDNPVIIFDDFTTSFHWIDYSFKVKSSAMKMLRPKAECGCIFRYIYYAIKCIDYVPGSHTRQWIGFYSKLPIPVPPIEVQREVVHLLDEYTMAHDELPYQLENELQLREQQLSMLRNELLTFGERERVRWATLGEIGEFMRGSSFQKKHFVGGGTPCIHYGQVHTRFNIATTEVVSYLDEDFAARMKRAQPGDLIIATTSEDDDAVGKAVAWLGDTDVVVSNDAYIYRHGLDPKYMAYCFASDLFQEPKRQYITGTKVRRLNDKSMSKIAIPVPPIEVQHEVVRMLDEHTAAHESLLGSIRDELQLAMAQLDHVRNQLLSFPEKVA